MADTIRHRRGPKEALPVLLTGELGLCTDTAEVFIGGGERGNIPLLTLRSAAGEPLSVDTVPAEGSGGLITGGAGYAVQAELGQAQVELRQALTDLEQALAELERQPGPPGQPGADGVSPVVSILREGDAVTITVTDALGVHTAVIRDGADAPVLTDIDCGTF